VESAITPDAASSDIFFRDSIASNSWDAGFDIKPDVAIYRCIAYSNDRSDFKLWSGVDMRNCLGYAIHPPTITEGLSYSTAISPQIPSGNRSVVGSTFYNSNGNALELADVWHAAALGSDRRGNGSLIILKNNIIDGGFELLDLFGVSEADISNLTSGSNNIFTDNRTGTARTLAQRIGRIVGDPMFVDITNGNFRLQSGSPAIGVGGNAKHCHRCCMTLTLNCEALLMMQARMNIRAQFLGHLATPSPMILLKVIQNGLSTSLLILTP